MAVSRWQVGNLFGNYRSIIITLYNGAFDSSSAIFLIVKVGARGGQSWEQLGHMDRHIGDTVWGTAESLLGPHMRTDRGPEQVAGVSLSLSLTPPSSPAAVRARAVPAVHVPLPGSLQCLAPPAHPVPDAAHPHPLPAAPRLQLRVRGAACALLGLWGEGWLGPTLGAVGPVPWAGLAPRRVTQALPQAAVPGAFPLLPSPQGQAASGRGRTRGDTPGTHRSSRCPEWESAPWGWGLCSGRGLTGWA